MRLAYKNLIRRNNVDIVTKTLSVLKSITAETISNAKSGHTGSALGASSILLALFHDHLAFDASGLNWKNRDRFVLSAGHTSALLYSLLHLFGFDISIDDLKNFRKLGSKTPGHPEYGIVPGVETTTGPLGQGVANAVGMAIAAKKLNNAFPELFNSKVYCYAGDGCLMEGVANEACSLAGTLSLDNLILLYDDNNVTIDGPRTLANAEDTAAKFKAMGWEVLTEEQGNNYFACTEAISKAKKSTKPTIIIFKTIIGIGTVKQGTCEAHAYPLSNDALEAFKASLGITESFFVPEDVRVFCQKATLKNNKLIEKWNKAFDKVSQKYDEFFGSEPDYDAILKTLCSEEQAAGRDISGKTLNLITKSKLMFGGTADLGASTKAVINGGGDFSATNRGGNNIHFGIREHAMGAVANGIALFEPKLNVFDSTFTVFSNYMLPSIRCRAMMNAPVMSIFSHDSINIGEDGPTHQPIEQIGQLRLIINLNVFRPATFAEVVAAYKFFLNNKKPTAMLITKSKISNPAGSKLAMAEKGGYIIFETKPETNIVIIATGSEVYLAIEVAKKLSNLGVRVVSMPCISEFLKQSNAYQKKVLPKCTLKVAIEASNDPIWNKFVGENGLIFGVDRYLASASGSEVYKLAGFDAEIIANKIKNHYLKLK